MVRNGRRGEDRLRHITWMSQRRVEYTVFLSDVPPVGYGPATDDGSRRPVGKIPARLSPCCRAQDCCTMRGLVRTGFLEYFFFKNYF